MTFFEALLTNSLLQTALFASFLASLASGVIGTYVVVKRIVFISGSIAHSVLGGMGLCLWLQRTQNMPWLSPMYGALFAGILSALMIAWIQQSYRQREDAIIAALWSTGMAIGVIFISITPGSAATLSSILVGNILWVNQSDIWILLGLNGLILSLVYLFYDRFLLICFDEDQALLRGVPVKRLYTLLLVLVAVTVVLMIQIVGIILVIAMLTLPPTIANLFSSRLSVIMLMASALGILFSFSGLALSYTFDWPPGATIALMSGTSYLGLLSFRR